MTTPADRSKYGYDSRTAFWVRAGESLDPFIDPTDSFLDWIVALQGEAHSLLNVFLNGAGFGRGTRYLFPWLLSRGRGEYTASRVRLERIAGALKRHGLDVPALSASIEGGSISEILVAAYGALGTAVEVNGLSAPLTSARPGDQFRKADYLGADARYLAPVRDLAGAMRGLGCHCDVALLHGSMATLDFVRGFSDLDTLLILNERATGTPGALADLQRTLYPLLRHMYRLDPLQHHGFFIVAAPDRAFYPETFFPLELFKYAKSVGDPRELTFALRPVERETRQAIWGIVQWMRAQYCTTGTFANLHEFKLFISFVLLLPALYLQARGQATYKKYSFEKLAAQYDGDRSILDVATQLRRSYFPDVSDLALTAWPWPPPIVQRLGKGAMTRRVSHRWPPDARLLVRGLALAEDLLRRVSP